MDLEWSGVWSHHSEHADGTCVLLFSLFSLFLATIGYPRMRNLQLQLNPGLTAPSEAGLGRGKIVIFFSGYLDALESLVCGSVVGTRWCVLRAICKSTLRYEGFD